MSRGHGRMMGAILGALRAASGPLAFGEIAIGIYGSRTVTRHLRGHRRGVVLPVGDASNLRRALRGLVRRGDVVVIGDHPCRGSARRPNAMRYAVSDRSTGNVGRPANEVTGVVLASMPANDTLTAPNGAGSSFANPTTHCPRSGSSELLDNSTRLTSAGVTPVSLRGALPVPARVFPWERALLASLVDDHLNDLTMPRTKTTTPTRDPRAAVVYLRVSTGRQARNDMSLPAQKASIEKFAEARGLRIVKIYTEPGASGRDDNRPAFREMIQEVLGTSSTVSTVLVLTLSRFMRDSMKSQLHKRKLRANGVDVIAVQQEVGEGPSGQLMENVF